SFISNVRQDRAQAITTAKDAAEMARRQAAELWAYYEMKLAERATLQVAEDRVRLDLQKQGVTRVDPSIKLDVLTLTEYEQRIRDFDADTQRVFYRVQALEKQEDVRYRQQREPELAVFRYDLGSKIITLALILLSVTILSNKDWLFWGGVALGSVGALLAF